MSAPAIRGNARQGLKKQPNGCNKRRQLQNVAREILPFENYRLATPFGCELFRPSLKEFKAWLKKTRTDANIEQIRRQYNDADFLRWHEQRLLPYLDLTFWAKTQIASFGYATLSQALFPDEIDQNVGEIIRKTVAPNALALVTDEVVSALIRQIQDKA